MKNIPLLFLYLLATQLQAQFTTDWQKRYGGTYYDDFSSTIQTSDGGTISIGSSLSNDGDASGLHGAANNYYDVWVVKTDPYGTLEWQKMYGGTKDEYGNDIQQTNDGGYIFTGETRSNDGDVTGFHGGASDCWVVKISATGNIQWSKAYGSNGAEYGANIQQEPDGEYLVAGYRANDYWLFKINTLGAIQWEHLYGGTKADRVGDMVLTNDMGVLLLGTSFSSDGDISSHHGGSGNTSSDYWAVKMDSLGVLEWEKSLGGTSNEVGLSAITTQDGNFLLTGISYSNDDDVTGSHDSGQGDAWIVKLAPNGEILWKKCLGGSDKDRIFDFINTSDSGYMLVGQTYSTDGDVVGNNHGAGDGWILKLTNQGLIVWQLLTGGSAEDIMLAISYDENSGYLIGGYSGSINGDLTGIPMQGQDAYDYWLIKLNAVTGLQNYTQEHLQLAPNPTMGFATFQSGTLNHKRPISITDLSGNQFFIQNNLQHSQLDISTLPAGIYIITAETDQGHQITGKLIKQ